MRSSLVPSNVIKSLVQYYIRKERAAEEILIVEQEIRETIAYWETQYDILSQCSLAQSSLGLKYILNERLLIVQNFVDELKGLFKLIVIPEADFDEEIYNINNEQEQQFSSDGSDESEDENLDFDNDLYI